MLIRIEEYKKMRFIFAILLVLITYFFSSCEKEESALDPISDQGGGVVKVAQIDLMSDYGKQVYFDFSSGSIVRENNTTEWELGFETKQNSFRIVLNESLVMRAANAGAVPFASVTSIAGLTFNYDHPQRKNDSLAIMGFMTLSGTEHSPTNNVYVLDLGKDPAGSSRGYAKMMITDLSAEKYHVKVARLDGSAESSLEIVRNQAYNYSYIAITDNGLEEVFVEPNKDDWDLLFTRYIHFFNQDDGSLLPYAVTGGLLNNGGATNYESDIVFDSFQLQDVDLNQFVEQRDLIGYDWKRYDFDKGYIIDKTRTFLLKDVENTIYKIRFLDFYSATKEKGTITFEYQKL